MRMVSGYQVVQEVLGVVGVEAVVGVETMGYIGMITMTLIYPKLPLEVPPLEGVDALTRTVLSYLAKMAWMMVWKWQPLGRLVADGQDLPDRPRISTPSARWVMM